MKYTKGPKVRQLMDIMRNHYNSGGDQHLTDEALAQLHVLTNKSVTAMADVRKWGKHAAHWLRLEEGFPLVPTSPKYGDEDAPKRDWVAGAGAGGPERIGWYMPTDRDDEMWEVYITHCGRSGVNAVFYAARQVDGNRHLTSRAGMARLSERIGTGAAISRPKLAERKVLEARLGHGTDD